MKIFHKVAQATGWTWSEVGDLTMDQLLYVASDGLEDTEKEQLGILKKIEGAKAKLGKTG